MTNDAYGIRCTPVNDTNQSNHLMIKSWSDTLQLGRHNACATLSFFFFSSRRRHTRFDCDWSSDVCSSDLSGGHVDPFYTFLCGASGGSANFRAAVDRGGTFSPKDGGTMMATGGWHLLALTDRKSVV